MGKRSFSLCAILAACVGVGMLGMPALAAPGDSIGVHWSYYNGYDKGVSSPQGISDVTGTDGVVPQSNWNNIGTKWANVDSPNTNLLDNNGAITTAAATVAATGAGSPWWVTGPTAGLDNLLVGPWGGDAAIPNVITGIPYTTYEIIAYLNPPYAGAHSVWLDSNPTSSDAANAPVAGSEYWFSGTASPSGFVEMTNNTDNTTYPAQNYVVYTGLTGSSQTMWVAGTKWAGWRGSGADPVNGTTNDMFTGFQIVDTSGVPEPASLSLLGAGALLLISRRRK
jgi:hypothetical protein